MWVYCLEFLVESFFPECNPPSYAHHAISAKSLSLELDCTTQWLGTWAWNQAGGGCASSLSLMSYVSLVRTLNLSEFASCPLNGGNNNTYFIGLLWRCNERNSQIFQHNIWLILATIIIGTVLSSFTKYWKCPSLVLKSLHVSW